VPVLVFSGSVELTVRREFKKDEDDPVFRDQIPDENIWNTYCDAFAA